MVCDQFPMVRLIRNDRNTGFATANNQGVMSSSGKYVLLLNSDTVVKPEALTHLVDFMDAHPEAGGAGSMLLNPDETIQPSCFPFPTIPREIWRLFHLDLIKVYGIYSMNGWDQNAVREVDHIQGASLVLRRETLDQVGLLDQDYFMYSEELDLCYRIKKSNWKLYWVPKSRVVHYGGQSTKQVAEKMFLELYRSKVLFFRKNMPNAVLIYKLSLLAAALFRILLSPMVLIERGKVRQFHLTRIKYYFRLISALPRM